MSAFFHRVITILTLRCEAADRLMSDSLDRRLAGWERVALWGHVVVCRACRTARRQLHILQRGLRDSLGEGGAAGDEALSPEARDRIKQALKRPG